MPIYNDDVKEVSLDRDIFHLFWSSVGVKKIEVENLIAVCLSQPSKREIEHLQTMFSQERIIDVAQKLYKDDPKFLEYIFEEFKIGEK
jgi:hypothetical protein